MVVSSEKLPSDDTSKHISHAEDSAAEGRTYPAGMQPSDSEEEEAGETDDEGDEADEAKPNLGISLKGLTKEQMKAHKKAIKVS